MELQKLVGSNLEEQKLNAYEKDIDKCEEGEKKGGYGINELKNIAITYYGLDEDEVKDYKKPELCKVIRRALNKIRKAKETETYLETKTSKVETKNNNTMNNNSDLYNMKYPGDIKLCNESPKKGGINYSKLKHIAENNFNIYITNITKKEELCELIKNKLDLELIKKVKDTQMNTKENTIDEEDDDEEDEEDKEDDEDEDDEVDIDIEED
jgi:hypothetical protein